MTCATCGAIPDTVSVNTGRDEYFAPPVTSLTKLGIESRDDLRECPACGAMFLWEDDTAFTGSGNNDSETLVRFAPGDSAVVRAFVRRGERPPAEVAALVPALLALSRKAAGLALDHAARRDRPLAIALAPALVGEAARTHDRWFVDRLMLLVSSRRDEAAAVRAAIDAAPDPFLAPVLERCRREACTICAAIFYDAKVNEPGAFRPRGVRDDLDLWECPGCDSMFRWQRGTGAGAGAGTTPGTITRTSPDMARVLRACLDHGEPVSRFVEQMLFSSSTEREQKIVLTHAMRHDRDLVRQLVPHILLALAWREPAWLRDVMFELVAGAPADAAQVLAAIDRLPRSSPAVVAVAAACRAAGAAAEP